MKLRIIGDVHQKTKQYLKLIKETDYSIQLGDFGFNYDCLDNVDSNFHKITSGNHDNMNIVHQYPHFLGDFGTYTIDNPQQIPFDCFFIRGGYSIDKAYRTEGISWWANEELSWEQMNECVKEYKRVKPDVVISHECPAEIIPYVVQNNFNITPSSTSRLLNELLTAHQPELWFFGHLHNTCEYHDDRKQEKKTIFYALDELDYIDLQL